MEKSWEWLFDQLGIIVLGGIVLVTLYKLFLATIQQKDKQMNEERERLSNRVSSLEKQVDENSDEVTKLIDEHSEELKELRKTYAHEVKELNDRHSKELKELAVDSIEALTKSTHLIQEVVASNISKNNKMVLDAIRDHDHRMTLMLQKLQSSINPTIGLVDD